MHLAAGVVDAHPIVGAEEVHAGERRDPDLLHVGTEEQARIDRHEGSVARRHVETVGTGDAGAVEQRADLQRIAWIVRPKDPKIGEDRKFFRLAEPGVQRQPACGDAEAGVAGDGPKIAGAQKSQQLLGGAAVLEHVVDAEASEPGVLGQWVGNLDGPEVEHRLIIEYLPGVALLHHEHPDRVTVVGAQMIELHREGAGAQGDGLIGPIADAPILVRRQVRQPLRCRGTPLIGLLRQFLGLNDQPLERKRLGSAHGHRCIRRSERLSQHARRRDEQAGTQGMTPRPLRPHCLNLVRLGQRTTPRPIAPQRLPETITVTRQGHAVGKVPEAYPSGLKLTASCVLG